MKKTKGRQMADLINELGNVFQELCELDYMYDDNENEFFSTATIILGEQYGIVVRAEDLSYKTIQSKFLQVLKGIWYDGYKE